MKYTEQATYFPCAGVRLLGIVARPEAPADTGVVVIVGGPQYRAGSHRQFVLLSRTLAAAGFAVLRFDYRGMGDSEGEPHAFEDISADIAAAVDALQQRVPQVRRVVLWGLCDGASAALLYCHDTQDARVSGLCLLNPWVRSAQSLARVQVKHYYLQRLMQKDFWAKVIRGGVRLEALRGLARAARGAAGAPAADKGDLGFQKYMALAWDGFDGSILLVLSGDDFVALEFQEHLQSDPAWKLALQHTHLVRRDLPGADHTFSSAAYRSEVAALTLWQGLRGAMRNTGRPPNAING